MSHIEAYPAVSTLPRRAIGNLENLNGGDFQWDQDLAETVERALRGIGRIALRGVVVEVFPESVVLHGGVSSYYEKQLAQAAAQEVVRGRRVVNEIEVVSCR